MKASVRRSEFDGVEEINHMRRVGVGNAYFLRNDTPVRE